MPTTSELIRADVYRIEERALWRDVARQFLIGETFRYNVAFRLAGGAKGRTTRLLGRIWLRRLRRRMGINIPYSTQIGPGLLIGHAGGIVINAAARIGSNCNISHNVTIGVSRGRNAGVPTIGDRVYIGPGAVLIGAIRIGDDVAVGANAVVTKSVPDQMTVHGPRAEVRSGGSDAYINRISEAAGSQA